MPDSDIPAPPKRETERPCPVCFSTATEPMDAHVREGHTVVAMQCQKCAHIWETKPPAKA
jgi:hypothetical protein